MPPQELGEKESPKPIPTELENHREEREQRIGPDEKVQQQVTGPDDILMAPGRIGQQVKDQSPEQRDTCGKGLASPPDFLGRSD